MLCRFEAADPGMFPCIRNDWFKRHGHKPKKNCEGNYDDIDTIALATDLRNFLRHHNISITSFSKKYLNRSQVHTTKMKSEIHQQCLRLYRLTASGSCSDFPGVDHEGRQACTVLISVVTQRGALVVRITYGCPYYKSPANFRLFCKVPEVKNCLFPREPLPLCKPLKFVQFGLEVFPAGEYLWLDILRAADES